MDKHIMVDLETLGTERDSNILSIGAVAFDPNYRGGDPLGVMKAASTFYVSVDPASGEAFGLKAYVSTILWWMQLEQTVARDRLLGEKKIDLYSSLVGFSDWLEELREPDGNGNYAHEIVIWGNGVLMDNLILKNAYAACQLPVPWTYKGDADFRTIRRMAGAVTQQPYGTMHHALDDAVGQAIFMTDILRARGVTV